MAGQVALPRDIRNLNEALEEIEKMSIQTTQGSYVKVEDVKRLLEERREVILGERAATPVPYRMPVERARRMAMQDEGIRETHRPATMREPGRSIPAGPTATEGVKS